MRLVGVFTAHKEDMRGQRCGSDAAQGGRNVAVTGEKGTIILHTGYAQRTGIVPETS